MCFVQEPGHHTWLASSLTHVSLVSEPASFKDGGITSHHLAAIRGSSTLKHLFSAVVPHVAICMSLHRRDFSSTLSGNHSQLNSHAHGGLRHKARAGPPTR